MSHHLEAVNNPGKIKIFVSTFPSNLLRLTDDAPYKCVSSYTKYFKCHLQVQIHFKNPLKIKFFTLFRNVAACYWHLFLTFFDFKYTLRHCIYTNTLQCLFWPHWMNEMILFVLCCYKMFQVLFLAWPRKNDNQPVVPKNTFTLKSFSFTGNFHSFIHAFCCKYSAACDVVFCFFFLLQTGLCFAFFFLFVFSFSFFGFFLQWIKKKKTFFFSCINIQWVL